MLILNLYFDIDITFRFVVNINQVFKLYYFITGNGTLDDLKKNKTKQNKTKQKSRYDTSRIPYCSIR